MVKTAVTYPKKNMILKPDLKLSDCPVQGGVVSDVTGIGGFTNGIKFLNNSVLSYSYVFPTVPLTGTSYTISAFVQKLDGTAPVITDNPSGDLCLVVGGIVATINPTVTSLGNGLYRVSASINFTPPIQNTGVLKRDTFTNKGFVFSGLQLEQGGTVTPFETYIPLNKTSTTNKSFVRNKASIRNKTAL